MKSKTTIFLAAALLGLCVYFFSRDSLEDVIVGRWINDMRSGEMIFERGGSGYIVSLGRMPFTYTVNGRDVKITTTGLFTSILSAIGLMDSEQVLRVESYTNDKIVFSNSSIVLYRLHPGDKGVWD